jgi:hypothetical protein
MGEECTLYSLRHYCDTVVLAYKRMSIYTLVKHMKYFFFLIFSVIHTVALSFPTYNTSEEIIGSSHLRSKYFLTSGFFDFGIDYKEFVEKSDKAKGIVVHSHGCSGVGNDDSQLRSFYTKLGLYFVQLDFHKRGDARNSCTVTNGILTYHDRVGLRVPPRVQELQNHVNKLRAEGFQKIYISGHSEGGMVLQWFPDEVSGAIIHSMLCIPTKTNNLKNKYLHLVSFNDPLLDKRNAPHTCDHRPNYTTVTSSVVSHGPLADSSWAEKIRNFLEIGH